MAALKIHFTANAIRTLDEILGFIAQDNPDAASKLSGRKIPEAPERRERELVVPPAVRIFSRADGETLWVLHAMRSEQAFHPEMLEDEDGG